MMQKISKIVDEDLELDSLIESSLSSAGSISDSFDSPFGEDESEETAETTAAEPKAKPIAPIQALSKGKSSLEDILNSIQSEFAEDVSLNIGNLKEKALMESAIKGKWASKLMAERVKAKILKKNYDELVEGLQKMYSEAKPSSKSFLNGRQSAEQMVCNSTEIKELKQQMADNRQIVDFLEYCWEIVKGLGFTIKNSLEATKIEMGI